MNSRIYSRQKVFVCPEQFSGQTKKSSLRDLCASVVKVNSFMFCHLTVGLSDQKEGTEHTHAHLLHPDSDHGDGLSVHVDDAGKLLNK